MAAESFHVILTSGQERDIRCDEVEFKQNGSVHFLNSNGTVAVAYAEGVWTMVEREARDDRE